MTQEFSVKIPSWEGSPLHAMRRYLKNSTHDLRNPGYAVDLISYMPGIFEKDINEKLDRLQRRVEMRKVAMSHQIYRTQ